MDVVFIGDHDFCEYYSIFGGDCLVCDDPAGLADKIKSEVKKDSLVLLSEKYVKEAPEVTAQLLNDALLTVATLPSFKKNTAAVT
jgi:hypothetical protein